MKAIVRYEYGAPLTVADLPDPVPTGTDVLVRVRAAGVDRGAWHIWTGRPTVARLAFGIPRPKDPKLGLDAAGIVEAVGPDVTRFRVGDEAFGVVRGSFADLALGAETHLNPKPASVSFEEAAAAPTSAVTAFAAIKGRSGRVLVLGAGGGVGHYAVQVARASGLHVTAATSAPEFVAALGADEVVDYRSQPLTGTYDLILDIGGRRPIRDLRALLAPAGALLFVGGEGGGSFLGGMGRQLVVAPFSKQKFVTFLALNTPAALAQVAEALATGTLRPHVDRVFALAEAEAALAHLTSGAVRGKVVLVP